MSFATESKTARLLLMDHAIAAVSHHSQLSPEDLAQLYALASHAERCPPGVHMFAEDDSRHRASLMVSGWACETLILMDGRRQVLSLLLPGDPILAVPPGSRVARLILTLTEVQVVGITPYIYGAYQGGSLSRVFAICAAHREERLLNQITRLGRLSAYERMVHLFLELKERLDRAGLVKDNSFRLPLTQEILADVLGLSMVHINRTLQQLRREKLIELRGGSVILLRPKTLSAIAGYETESPRVRRPDTGQIAIHAL